MGLPSGPVSKWEFAVNMKENNHQSASPKNKLGLFQLLDLHGSLGKIDGCTSKHKERNGQINRFNQATLFLQDKV